MDMEAIYSGERMSFQMGKESVISGKSSDEGRQQNLSDRWGESCTCTVLPVSSHSTPF